MRENLEKDVEREAIRIAGICVDEFLAILQEWFHPDKNWDRIESTAKEFLVEAIIRETKQAIATAKKEGQEEARAVPMGVSQWRNHGEKYHYAKFFEDNKSEIIKKEERQKILSTLRKALPDVIDEHFPKGDKARGRAIMVGADLIPFIINPEDNKKDE